jgi:hypothetical protein
MLSGGDPGQLDLVREKYKLKALVPEDLVAYISNNDRVWELNYPVKQYPVKIRSLNFDKDPLVYGQLMGIKGQYLIFDQDRVMNMRKFGGYLIRFRAPD